MDPENDGKGDGGNDGGKRKRNRSTVVPPGVDKDGKQLPMDDTSKLTAQQSYVAKGQSDEKLFTNLFAWAWKAYKAAWGLGVEKLERELGGRRGGSMVQRGRPVMRPGRPGPQGL